MKYRIEIFRGRINKQWFFRIVHRNGNTLATSEGYTRKASAVKAALNLAGYGGVIPVVGAK